MSGTARPYFSVVIPAYNEEENVARCLEAVANQDFPADRYEVIVADNGSTDDTARIAEDHGATVIDARRPGPAAARNAGARSARGEILAFIDCDCIASHQWLRRLADGFEVQGVGAVAGEIRIGAPRTEVERLLGSINYLSQAEHLENPIMPFAATANVAYRRDVFERLGGFDESLRVGEDADLSWRLQRDLGLRIGFQPQAEVEHVRAREATLWGFCKQRWMHGRGIVARRRKYPDLVRPRTLRESYWNYRALAKRGVRLLRQRVTGRTTEDYPLKSLLFWSDLSYAVGRLYGSLRYRVWYL
jgi:cellulose synthase/poly-beta-1,6-N-acetylglucosamine synthase-like glycosyltransferase